MVDFHGLRPKREAELHSDLKLLAVASEQYSIELACATAADVTFAISTEERNALLEAAPSAAVEVLPNIFQTSSAESPGPEARRDLFFVGNFWHSPNVDAVCWFVERIFPRIKQAVPDIVLRIVGPNAGDEVAAHES
jgi:O-antigen biosynthesis protein